MIRKPVLAGRLSGMWKIKGLFAEAKQNHQLSSAEYRGQSKVYIQAYLSAMVMNDTSAIGIWLLPPARPLCRFR